MVGSVHTPPHLAAVGQAFSSTPTPSYAPAKALSPIVRPWKTTPEAKHLTDTLPDTLQYACQAKAELYGASVIRHLGGVVYGGCDRVRLCRGVADQTWLAVRLVYGDQTEDAKSITKVGEGVVEGKDNTKASADAFEKVKAIEGGCLWFQCRGMRAVGDGSKDGRAGPTFSGKPYVV